MNMEELIEIDLDSDDSIETLPSPRLELDGVLSEQELYYIKSMTAKQDSGKVPLYIIFGVEKIFCGNIGLTLDNILELKYIGINKYFLYLINNDETLAVLQPNDEKREIVKILNFIKIRK